MREHGWKGRIGRIEPAIWWEGLEWAKVLPEGFDVVVTSLGVGRLTSEELQKAYDSEVEALRRLARAGVDVINIGGSPVVGVQGVKGHNSLLEKALRETDLPVATSLGAEMNGLRALGIRRVIMISPYPPDRNENRREILEELGFEVVHIETLGLADVDEIGRQPGSVVYRMVRQALRKGAKGDGIYIPCPVWPVMDSIAPIEADFGLPVVANVQAQAWACLRAIGYRGTIDGYGRLLHLQEPPGGFVHHLTKLSA